MIRIISSLINMIQFLKKNGTDLAHGPDGNKRPHDRPNTFSKIFELLASPSTSSDTEILHKDDFLAWLKQELVI